jgi:hypothetical protein
MSSLDFSKNRLGGFYKHYRDDGSGYGSFTSTPEGPKVIADAIKDMRALLFLDISENNIGTSWYLNPAYEASPVKEYKYKNTTGGGQDEEPAEGFGPIGVIAVANAIKDMGALSSANLLQNSIPVEQARELLKIMQAKENLSTLCGLSREETELDFSKQRLGAGDAVIIANDISDMGALTSLNLASNSLGTIIGWKYNDPKHTRKVDDWRYEHSDGRHQKEKPSEDMGKAEGVIALANAIPGIGALIKLDIRNNDIGTEQKGGLQRICVASGIELAM